MLRLGYLMTKKKIAGAAFLSWLVLGTLSASDSSVRTWTADAFARRAGRAAATVGALRSSNGRGQLMLPRDIENFLRDNLPSQKSGRTPLPIARKSRSDFALTSLNRKLGDIFSTVSNPEPIKIRKDGFCLRITRQLKNISILLEEKAGASPFSLSEFHVQGEAGQPAVIRFSQSWFKSNRWGQPVAVHLTRLIGESGAKGVVDLHVTVSSAGAGEMKQLSAQLQGTFPPFFAQYQRAARLVLRLLKSKN